MSKWADKNNDEKAKIIVETVIVVLFFAALIVYGVFYWTSCAFTPIAEAPVLCISK